MQTTLSRYEKVKTDEKSDQRKRILELLLNNDFVATATLRLFAYQYNARIYELRRKGWIIKSMRKDNKCGFTIQ